MRSHSENPRVAVAMSGGVDSSVAAALLVQQGYQVVGLTMKLYDHDSAGLAPDSVRGCCSLDAIHRAQAVCQTLKIPHYSVDLISNFKHCVIDDFVSEYISGRTPNPCVRCNTYLKWGALFEKARVFGCDLMATGHYAQIRQFDGGFQLWRASDRNKDQAYALWGIPKEKLAYTLLPLGGLSKPQVRAIAAELGLKTATAPESQEICFIPDDNYAEFLSARRPDLAESLAGGDLVEEMGGSSRPVGIHSGYPFYTVGQRKGLGGGFPEPRYVLRTDPETNQVVIGKRERLLQSKFCVDQMNWLILVPRESIQIGVQIRYRSAAVPGKVVVRDHDGLVELDEPAEAVTPGQSAVFFQGDRLIGGGRIMEVLPS